MKIHRTNLNNAFGKLGPIGSLSTVLALLLGTISCASLFFLAPSVSAQKTSGTITGTLTDPSGAVVPGATVSLVNERTGAARETATNEEGSFSFPELDAGTYRINVNKAGFKKLSLRNVELHVADVTTLNLKMEMGAATETVMVEAAPVAVNTSTGEVLTATGAASTITVSVAAPISIFKFRVVTSATCNSTFLRESFLKPALFTLMR